MSRCAYCGSKSKLTREHVFPDFLEKFSDSFGLYYSNSVKGAYLPIAPTVKDVCGICNNGVLSQLDEYVSGLYKEHFHIELTDTITIHANRSLMVRWLLKVLFNAARSFKGIPRVFFPFRKYILGEDKKPPHQIFLFCGVVRSGFLKGKSVRARDIRASDIHIPELELGVELLLSHALTLNSYSFLIISFIDRPKGDELKRLFKILQREGYTLSNNKGRMRFNPCISRIDHVTNKGIQRQLNPEIYPKNGVVSFKNKSYQLKNFPQIVLPPIQTVGKIYLSTVSRASSRYSLLGAENFDNIPIEFSQHLGEELFIMDSSQDYSAHVMRRNGKTYLRVDDLGDPGIPLFDTKSGVHQSQENWALWAEGIARSKSIFLYKYNKKEKEDDIVAHMRIPVLNADHLGYF